MGEPTAERTYYRPSGRVDAAGFVAHGLVGLAVAGLLAVATAWFTANDLYMAGFVTLLVAMIVCGLLSWVVAEAKCRNPAVAAALGTLLGSVAYFGMYHVDQCRRWGVAWERLDLLPGFVLFRADTDGWRHAGKAVVCEPRPPRAGVQPWRRDVPMEWSTLVYVFEAAVCLAVPAVLGWRRACRPFSEAAGGWCASETVPLTAESLRAMRERLRIGDVTSWALGEFERAPAGDNDRLVAVWYTPLAAGAEAVPDVYISGAGGGYARLDPEEIAALATVLPGLEQLAAGPEELVPLTKPGAPPAEVARLYPVPGDRVGAAKSPRVKYRGRVVSWLIVFGPVAPAAVFFGTVYLMHEAGAGAPAMIAVMIPMAVATLMFIGYWTNADNDVQWKFLVWYYRGVITRQALERPDALFPPLHPDAAYVEMLPRRVWGDVANRADECEGGLLLIDAAGRRVLFEGDRYRYEVPFASIEGCHFEEVRLQHLQQNYGTTAGFYAVVLTVRTETGTRELPLSATANLPGANRHERAQALLARFEAALGADPKARGQ